jgi:hypothetical protein
MTDALTDSEAPADDPDRDPEGVGGSDATAPSTARAADPSPSGAIVEPPVRTDEPGIEERAAEPLHTKPPATATITTGSSASGSGSRPRANMSGSRMALAWQRFIDMPVEGYITLFVVAACVIFVFVQLKPGLLFSNTTPAGGDMGAHVWAPAYLRDHLLTKGRLTGWTPDWYAGFPAFQFYMIVPSFMIAILSLVIPYGVAFKLVAVSGCVSLPFCAYYFGKMARLPFPAPALMSVAAMLYLFDRSFSIYGGNIPSTLAGEFAFSISLSFALLYLGVLARGLETGRYRGWAAVLLALTGLCHLIPFIFVLVGTGIWILLRPGWGQLKWLLTMGPVGGALVLFWMLPFYGRSGYMNDMGWEKIERYKDYLWDRDKLDPQLVNVPDLKWVIAFAAVGLLLSLVYRRRAGVFLAVAAGVFALGFIYAPQGRLWNARLLPFYYLLLYLLAAVGIAELGRLLSALFARDVNRPIRSVAALTPLLGWAVAATMLGMSLQVMPFGKLDSEGVYRWGPGGLISTKDRSFIDSWAEWNFQGYEGFERPILKDATGAALLDADGNVRRGPVTYKKSYPEYHDLMIAMKDLGAEKGCGRAMWEHEEQHDRYGTPMALMLLPFWTDGCIGSMEGLYFEASTTTPYHFINQDELSWGPSNAQRDLPYGPGPTTKPEFDLGIKHLQLDGVTYYMAINDNTKAFANTNPSLTQIKTSGPWTIYSVADAPLVEALKFQPAVLTGQPTTGRPWQDTSVCWYQNEASWDVFLAADGPADWQRVERTVIPDEKALPADKCAPQDNWGWFDANGGPDLKAQKAISVSTPIVSDDSISFDVSEPGVPVLVKASYFPNWKVSGADGPYRVTPNFMVVIPTANHVELHYGYTGLDIFSYLLTFLGLVGLFFLFKVRPVTVKPARPFWGRAERPDLYPSIGPDLRFENEGFEQDAAAALAAIIPDFGGGYGYGLPIDRPPDGPPTSLTPDYPDYDGVGEPGRARSDLEPRITWADDAPPTAPPVDDAPHTAPPVDDRSFAPPDEVE